MESRGGEAWYDEAAGPLVRPYAVTHGRTRGGSERLDLITLVLTVEPRPNLIGHPPESSRIVELCRRPVSVAEISARLNLPLIVVKVLVGDLIQAGYVISRSTEWRPDVPDRDILQAVIDGLREI